MSSMFELDQPVGLAIVGLGRWAKVLGAAIGRSPALRLVGGTSRSEEKRRAFAEEFACRVYPDLAGLLDDPEVEGVVVTAPNDQHWPIIQEVAAAGKPVYVEKPIAGTVADGIAIVRACRQAGVPLAVGHSARLMPGLSVMRRAIEEGRIGELVLLESNFSNDRAMGLTPQHWRWYRAGTPGGPVSQLASHHFDNLQYLAGSIARVSAMIESLHTPAEVDTVGVCIARHEADVLSYTGTSWVSPGTYYIQAFGTEAVIHYRIDFNYWDHPHLLHEHGDLYLHTRDRGWGDRVSLEQPAGDMFVEELEAFGAAARGLSPPLVSGEDGLRALAAVYAAIEAAETGRTVEVVEVLSRAEAAAVS